MAATYYRHPSRQLVLVGVTGTNGKTTIATLLFRIFRSLGFDVGLFSTIRNQINESLFPATHTTPDALQLQSLMRRTVDAGCTHCFMEVTSHSADQDRIAGLDFDGAIFTNLTHDHLDYHGTVEAYYGAKKRFFDDLPDTAFALTNADDPLGLAIVNNTGATRYTYSLRGRSTFKGVVVKDSLEGLEVSVHGKRIGGKLVGQFNAYNLVAVFGAAVLLNIDIAELEGAMQTLRPVVDRRAAILAACESAQPGDVVLVAGRGHEEYQQIGKEKIPFKDIEVLRDALANVGRAVVAGSLAVESVPKGTIGKTW
jgi:UDP-N-acetylmuramoyl-L-alanyl-D-glutamate--2,6-diaminopimelate ligase